MVEEEEVVEEVEEVNNKTFFKASLRIREVAATSPRRSLSRVW